MKKPPPASRGAIAATAFGPVLRRLRQERGLSQADFAEEAGIDRTFISQLERGIHQPTLAVFIVVARVLRINPTRLMSLTVKEIQTTVPPFLYKR